MAQDSKPAGFRRALVAAKLSGVGLHALRRAGTNFPGEVANRFCPDFLDGLEPTERSIFVTGSTGKTTTTNLIADLLVAMGEDPITNRAGSNINTGIETAYLSAADLDGRPRKKIAAIEIDERWCPTLLPVLKPTVMVVTNLGRDSFHRNANVDVVYRVLDEALKGVSRLVLNGDDLISHTLAKTNQDRVYFGIDRLPEDADEPRTIINDCLYCPECGARLVYEFSHYNHIGRAHCPKCSFRSPELDYEMLDVDWEWGFCHIRENSQEAQPVYEYPTIGPDITDLYNEIAAIAALRELGYPAVQIGAVLRGVRTTSSRYKERQLGSKKVVSVLTKGQNPVGCSRSFDRIRSCPGTKAVIVMLDDDRYIKVSSEYTGWYYECDFEYLCDPSIRQIALYGVRSYDLELRLLLAGISSDQLILAESPETAVAALDLDQVDTVCISFDNYNAYLCERATQALEERLGGGR